MKITALGVAAALLAFAISPALLARASEPRSADARPVYQVAADARGVWGFVGPDGKRFVSLGVNNVSPEPHQPRAGTDYYNPVASQFGGDKSAWGAWARDLLASHGFNTAGCWSNAAVPAGAGFYHTPILYLGATPFHQCLDAFRPDFPERAARSVAKAMAGHPDRSAVLGVFLDNEMPWWGKSGWDRTTNYTLLERALEEEPAEPARVAAMGVLKGRFADAAAFSRATGVEIGAWGALTATALRAARGPEIEAARQEYIGLVADRYYRLGTEVVRKHLPGVLILGSRFAGDAPDPVIAACGRYCDVISFNDYHGDPTAPDDLIARYWILGKRPLMITEFAWRAAENLSGNPNSAGAGAVVPRQADRAARYAAYLRACFASPVIIGMHWFEFSDQSPQGRFDGENSNYGIVSIRNERYEELLGAMKAVHATIPGLRSSDLGPPPASLPKPRPVEYRPGQHPGRPPTLDLLSGPFARDPEVWGAPDAGLTLTRADGALVMAYRAGTAYGTGVNLFGPASARCASGPDFATDLDGYKDLVVDVDAPRGVQLNVVVAEAGSGPVGQVSYASPAGDDGEAFISAAFFGQGERTLVRISIAALLKQQFWGNQSGGNTIEMAAVRCVGLQIQGAPATGTVRLHGLRLER